MKTRLPRILAIMVTLVLLTSLMVFAAPVSAGTLSWSAVGIPSLTGNVLVAAALDVTAVAVSPNFATDKTLFAGVADAATINPQVYRSTNGGYTWTASSSTLGAVADVIVALVVSPTYATDQTLFVATQTPAGGAGTGKVYRSTNGGSSFSQLGVVTLAAGEKITSLDVSPNYDGVGTVAIGVANLTVATYATATMGVQLWGSGGALNWTAAGPPSVVLTGVDVLAVKFSPSYPVDATLLAITADGGAGGLDMATAQPYLRARVGSTWDVAIVPTLVGATAVRDLGAGAGSVVTAMVTPSDYNGSVSTLRRVFASVVANADVAGGVTTATNSGVYRITGSGALSTGLVLTPLGSDLMGSIAYNGTFGAGTLVTGRYMHAAAIAANVYRTTNPADAATAVLWYGATNAPTGVATAAGTVAVALDPSFATSKMAVAGTQGSDSAFAISTDGAAAVWNESGLIDNAGVALAAIGDNALSPKFATDTTMYIVTNDGSGGAFDTSVWRSVNGGTNWLRLMVQNFVTAGIGKIALSPAFDTDSTMFVGDVGATQLFYSTDKGATWSSRPVSAGILTTGIAAMAATDANTLYVGDSGSGKVAKTINAGWVWSAANVKATGSTGNITSLVAKGSTVVVGDTVSTVFRSDDAGVTWARVGPGAFTTAGASFVDFDDTYVYAVSAAAPNAFRFQTGVSTVWYQMTSSVAPLNPSPVLTAGAGIVIASDKTLYALDAAATANQVVYRTLTPNIGPTPAAPTFEWMQGLTAVAPVDISVVAGASNIIQVVQGTAISQYTDTLSAGSPGPTLVGPANNATVDRNTAVIFAVDNASNAQVTSWDIQISTDQTFTNNVVTVTQVPPGTQTIVNLTTVGGGALNLDQTLYWRSRATLGSPLRGPVSAVRTLSPQLTILPNYPALVQPVGTTAINVSINPVFNWSPYKYATNYELQISKDAAFTTANLVVNLTGAKALGPVTSYYLATALDYSTAYFWRVKAISGGQASDWSPGVGFVTMAKPVPPVTTPPITIPPAPTPTITVTVPPISIPPTQVTEITPAWIYAIIAIGAILVIAVVVLIVRTRRVV